MENQKKMPTEEVNQVNTIVINVCQNSDEVAVTFEVPTGMKEKIP